LAADRSSVPEGYVHPPPLLLIKGDPLVDLALVAVHRRPLRVQPAFLQQIPARRRRFRPGRFDALVGE
jgi:hypothetical protein